MNFNFSEMGITLENAKEFEQAFADYKKALKVANKDADNSRKASAVDAANKAIESGAIVAGATIVIRYNKAEVIVTVKTTPNTDQKNIAVTGEVLENKDHFLYCPKENFVSMA